MAGLLHSNKSFHAKGGLNTNTKIPDGVTYEGPLYRNVGTMPDGTPVNPLGLVTLQMAEYRIRKMVKMVCILLVVTCYGREMGAYGSNPYVDNRTTYHYDSVSVNNMLDLTNLIQELNLVDLADLISSDYKNYSTTDISPAVTHAMGNLLHKMDIQDYLYHQREQMVV